MSDNNITSHNVPNQCPQDSAGLSSIQASCINICTTV